jgi:hypothetical protein
MKDVQMMRSDYIATSVHSGDTLQQWIRGPTTLSSSDIGDGQVDLKEASKFPCR